MVGRLQPTSIAGVGRNGKAEMNPAELQCDVAGFQRRDQLPVNPAPRYFFRSTGEDFTLFIVEVEFNGSASEVPGDVLAAGEIMAEGMVEGVRLQEPTVGQDHPFERLQAIVG